MRRGEIFLAAFPFGDRAEVKLRPVLLLTDGVGIGSEVIAAYISSVVPARLLLTDVELSPATSDDPRTGLKVASVLRLHKIATLHRTVLQRRLGAVPPEIHAEVITRLQRLFAIP